MASVLSYWAIATYVVFSIILVIVGTQKLTPMGTGLAVIYAIGSVLVLVFFGIRWFSKPGTDSTNWPPTINMCPDYLTFVPNVASSRSVSGGGCVDLLGVRSKDSGLVKANPSDLASLSSSNTNKLFEYTAPDVNAALNDLNMIQAICTRCQITGLTWEGVYDGDTCIGINRAKLVAAGTCPQ